MKFDPQTLVDQFAQASAKQAEQLRRATHDATLQALQGRELTIKNIRSALKTVSSAVSQGAAQNGLPGVDVEGLLEKAVAGMDDALVKAVEANRLALQRFADQGADLREKHLKKALGDLEKFEDMLMTAARKAAGDAGAKMAGPWSQVLDKMQVGGSQAGSQASAAAEQFASQMQTALRDSRAAGVKAAVTMAESYTALVSGVLIGMADAMAATTQPAAPRKGKSG